MKRLSTPIGFLLFALLIGGYFYVITQEQAGSKQINFGTSTSSNSDEIAYPWLNFAIILLSMLTGILFGSFYAQIKERVRITSLRSEILKVFRSAHLIRSFLIAPIIFIGIYKAIDSYPDRILSALFAFQNGFFCDTILRKKSEETS